MKIVVAENYQELSKLAARIIAEAVQSKPDGVLGLATGSTPLGTYQELIRIHHEEGLDFSRIVTFNLDEYYGLHSLHPQSYGYFMRENLFKHINIDLKNTHIPNGTPEDLEAECRAYDELLTAHGGIDLQLLGIGENGHVGFNEPSANLNVYTHLVQLKEETIRANSRFFSSLKEVPTQAITMGLGGILKAKKILLLAAGKAKAPVIAKLLEGKLSTQVPASILQVHPQVVVIVDQEIGHELKLKKHYGAEAINV